MADPAKDNEVVINENFAQAHGFNPENRFAKTGVSCEAAIGKCPTKRIVRL